MRNAAESIRDHRGVASTLAGGTHCVGDDRQRVGGGDPQSVSDEREGPRGMTLRSIADALHHLSRPNAGIQDAFDVSALEEYHIMVSVRLEGRSGRLIAVEAGRSRDVGS